jgi:hypothetical protein
VAGVNEWQVWVGILNMNYPAHPRLMQTSQGQHMHMGGGLAGYTPKQVEEVKMVLRLLPIFGTTVLYW